MISFTHKGNFKKTENFFKRIGNGEYTRGLKDYAEAGLSALREATPVDTGKTADSWGYRIEKTRKGIQIVWTNDNINDGVNVAIVIQYGHGMPSGYYVQGIDYINPALKPLFDLMGKKVWKEVTRSA